MNNEKVEGRLGRKAKAIILPALDNKSFREWQILYLGRIAELLTEPVMQVK